MTTPAVPKAVAVLRWIAIPPAAVIAAWAAWILLNLLGRFSLSYAGVTPESFLGQFYFNTAGHAAMGATFVYAGARVAPVHQLAVVYVLAVLGIFSGGVTLVPAILGGNGWAMWGSVCVVAGIAAMVYLIHHGELDPQ